MDLNVVRSGTGTPVVLLHGLTATHRYVVMGSTKLQRSGHDVIAYDARGHGRSARAQVATAYSYDELVADLIAVLDAAGIERATLAGASMGAHTAIRAALIHPERVAALVIITPAHLPGAEPATTLAHWDARERGLRSGGIEGFVAAERAELAAIGRHADTVLRVIRQRLAEHSDLDAVADALHTVPRSVPFKELSELAAITVPTAVIADRDESDPDHPLAVAQAYAEAIRPARMHVEEPGRSPLAWQGSQVARIIAETAAARADRR